MAGTEAAASRAGAAGSLPVGSAYATDRLNLREGPGLEYRVLLVMPYHAVVEVTGAPEDGFYPVDYAGLSGWAFGDYLEPGRPPETVERMLPVGPAYTTDRLKLRRGPGPEFGVITVMPSLARVRITGGPRNGYYPVLYNDTPGWASGDYLEPGRPPAFIPISRVQRLVRRTLIRNGLGHEWSTAARIIACESGWDPSRVVMDRNGYHSRGLWQINDRWYASWWERFDLNWRNPVHNTEVAIKIYRSWGGWGAWSCR